MRLLQKLKYLVLNKIPNRRNLNISTVFQREKTKDIYDRYGDPESAERYLLNTCIQDVAVDITSLKCSAIT